MHENHTTVPPFFAEKQGGIPLVVPPPQEGTPAGDGGPAGCIEILTGRVPCDAFWPGVCKHSKIFQSITPNNIVLDSSLCGVKIKIGMYFPVCERAEERDASHVGRQSSRHESFFEIFRFFF